MAQQSIVGGLFGLTPEMYVQNRSQQELTQARQLGQGIGTLSNVGALAAQQGQMIGRGVGALLGVEDPQLQMVRDVQEMRNQFDVSTPTGLRDFASALAGKGYTDLAIQASARAADIDKDIAAAQKARMERIPAAQEQADRIRLAELTDQYGPVEGARRFREEQLEGKRSVAKAGAPGEQQDKELRTARVKKFTELEDRAANAQSTLQTVQDFNNVIEKSFTGVGSGAKLTAAQVANALGVTVTGTKESEQLDQLFAALTIGQAKNLKGALSDKDVKFLKEAVGNRGLTKETIQAVVDRIARDAQIAERTYGKVNQYYGKGGDIAKFDFAAAEKEAGAEVNDLIAKQRRLNELRRKQQGQ